MAQVAEAAPVTHSSYLTARGLPAIKIDRYVGDRLRERRVQLGITQQRMAELLGVTYQQAHKYEKGINRMSAGRLHQIAVILGVDVDYFYQGLMGSEPPEKMRSKRLFLELSRTFSQITDDCHREAVLKLAKALGSHSPG
jgi:transcriptional regulator with XRE-family HTH domain